MLLGAELKKLRIGAGLSIRALGEKIGKHNSYVTRVENGKQFIDFATLLDFIKATGGNAEQVIRAVVAELERKAGP